MEPQKKLPSRRLVHQRWKGTNTGLLRMVRKWLSGFTPTTEIASVVDENGTLYDIPSELSAIIREKVSFDYTSNHFDLEWLRIFFGVNRDGDPTRFKLIKGVHLWREMTGNNLKESKRVLDLAEIAFEAGKEAGKEIGRGESFDVVPDYVANRREKERIGK